MKKRYSISITVLLLTMVITGCKKLNDENSVVTSENRVEEMPTLSIAPTNAPTNAPTISVKGDTGNSNTQLYKDGVYAIETEVDYEQYYTEATVTIEDSKITNVDWTIIDKGHDNTPFDEEYYKVMEPYGDLYAQQAKKDWSGSRGYSDLLIETQDVDQVDAVSGATWANKKFKEAVELALEEAKEE